MSWAEHIRAHYEGRWGPALAASRPAGGRSSELPSDFSILRFGPRAERPMWTYATCGMSQPSDVGPLELHIFSPRQDEGLETLLAAIAHFHRTGAQLGLNHSVNFGQPWLDNSPCEFGLVSLPYLDGPALEQLGSGPSHVSFFWLIPITASEVAFKKQNGVDALEERFETVAFDYSNPCRQPVA